MYSTRYVQCNSGDTIPCEGACKSSSVDHHDAATVVTSLVKFKLISHSYRCILKLVRVSS